MTQRDWLLLLVAVDGDRDGLDQIRIQKGLFLLGQEGGLPQSERHRFVPYNHGPMSERDSLAQLREIRRLIDGLDFRTLLAMIYRRHPAYGERSVFRRP